MRRILIAALCLLTLVSCHDASARPAERAWRLVETIHAENWGGAPIAVSPDGKLLAACIGPKIVVRDARTGEVRYQLSASPARLAFSPDSKLLAAAPGVFAFSPNSKTVLGSATIWDAAGGRKLAPGAASAPHLRFEPVPHAASQSISAAISPNGKLIATGSDGGLILWNAATRKRIRFFQGPASERAALNGDDAQKANIFAHPGNVRAVLFSPSGGRLVSVGGDCSIREWNPATGKLLKIIDTPAGVQAAAFAERGRELIAAYRRDIVILAFPSGKIVAKLTGHNADVQSLAISRDSRTLWSAADDGTIKRWDLARRICAATYGQIDETAVSAYGGTLAYSRGDNRVIVQDLRTGARRCVLAGLAAPTSGQGDNDGVIQTLALSPDGRLLAGGAYSSWHGLPGSGGELSSRVMLWNTRTSKLLHVWGNKPNEVFEPSGEVAFSPSGRQLVELSPGLPDSDYEIRIRSLPSGKILHRWIAIPNLSPNGIDTPAYGAMAIAFENGQVLFADSRSNAKPPGLALWNAATGRVIGPLQSSTTNYYGLISANAHLIAASQGEDNAVVVWDIRTRRKLRTIRIDKLAGQIALSADDRWLADADSTSTAPQPPNGAGSLAPTPITLRNAKTGAVLGTLNGPAGGVSLLAITKNDTQVVARSADGIVRVWQR